MLRTEKRNPASRTLDRMSTEEILTLMQEEDRRLLDAVATANPAVCAAAEGITARLRAGGRLFYLGCGTSGRLAVADAAECPPTFGVPPDTVCAVMAGGHDAVFRAAEGAEDDGAMAVRDLSTAGLTGGDALLGISASGGAPYVCAGLSYARGLGCFTAAIASNPGTPLLRAAQVPIFVDSGPEVLTGSTRLKAGTAAKLILNRISTAVMVRLGYVYENMMINLKPTNEKLTRRMCGIVSEITGAAAGEAEAALSACGWDIRRAAEKLKGDMR